VLKIHGVPISVHTRKVIVATIVKELPYHNEPVIPFTAPAGWDRLSPTGRIPVMQDGDLTLADSSVICAYLDRKHVERPLLPSDTKNYARALWLEEYADGTLFREVVHPLFFQTYIRPNILKQQTDRTVVEKTLADALPKVFGYLNEVLSGAYAVGSALTLADIALVSNFINYQYLGFQLDRQQHPGIAAHFDHAIRHPAIRTALGAEQSVATAMGLRREFLAPILGE
jgi:glutathione S-transferase